jgi:hypothetical protein
MSTKLRKLHEMNANAGVFSPPRRSGRCTSVGSAPTATDSNLSAVGSLLDRIYRQKTKGV